MGDPRRIRKKYKTPRQPFERHRIDTELQLIGKYGLRNMKSVWKHSTMLRHFRGFARKLLSLPDEDREIGERELIGRLQRMGLLSEKATLDNVLTMQIEDFLERRLQTMVFRKGMASSPYHARQLITHGHIAIDNRVIKFPSYMVKPDEEKLIAFESNSPYTNSEHTQLPSNIEKRRKEAEEKRKANRKKRQSKGGSSRGRSSRGGRGSSSRSSKSSHGKSKSSSSAKKETKKSN
jgi:small subunit ribosomal protein S4